LKTIPEEIPHGYSAKYTEIKEEIDCLLCKIEKITVIRIHAWYEWKTSHISARTKFYQDPKFKVKI
jgi:hypothetical protein